MITRILRELREELGEDSLSFNDAIEMECLREKMEEIAHEYYWQGFNDGNENNLPKVEQTYGGKEDQEDS